MYCILFLKIYLKWTFEFWQTLWCSCAFKYSRDVNDWKNDARKCHNEFLIWYWICFESWAREKWDGNQVQEESEVRRSSNLQDWTKLRSESWSKQRKHDSFLLLFQGKGLRSTFGVVQANWGCTRWGGTFNWTGFSDININYHHQCGIAGFQRVDRKLFGLKWDWLCQTRLESTKSAKVVERLVEPEASKDLYKLNGHNSLSSNFTTWDAFLKLWTVKTFHLTNKKVTPLSLKVTRPYRTTFSHNIL